MPGPDHLRAHLGACAERTARGSAHVTVASSLAVRGARGHDWAKGTMHGVVDFGSDRCRLDGDARLVFDGAATYTELEGGGWIRDAGTPGTRSMFHPRFALEALRRACTNVRAVSGEQFSVELDRSVLDRIVHAGVSPIWAVSAEVRLDQAGRVTNADLKLWDPSEPGEAMHLSYSLDGFAGPLTIDLPQVVET